MKIYEINNQRQADRLLDEMFRYKNTWGITVQDAARFCSNLVSKNLLRMHVWEYDPIDRSYSDVYKQNHGEWMHSAGRTISHNDLGMRWAGRMLTMGHDVKLSDSPDIWGKLSDDCSNATIVGDVGQCSVFPAFKDGLYGMITGSLWVSVFEGREVILEAMCDIAYVLQESQYNKGMLPRLVYD